MNIPDFSAYEISSLSFTSRAGAALLALANSAWYFFSNAAMSSLCLAISFVFSSFCFSSSSCSISNSPSSSADASFGSSFGFSVTVTNQTNQTIPLAVVGFLSEEVDFLSEDELLFLSEDFFSPSYENGSG